MSNLAIDTFIQDSLQASTKVRFVVSREIRLVANHKPFVPEEKAAAKSFLSMRTLALSLCGLFILCELILIPSRPGLLDRYHQTLQAKPVGYVPKFEARTTGQQAPFHIEFQTYVHFVREVIGGTGQKLESDKIDQLARTIVSESMAAGFDPLFVTAMIKAESTFNHEAVSQRGAKGLMQIMPDTGKYISGKNQLIWDGAEKLHDPEYNLRLGLAYIKYLEKNFNADMRRVLIAYNWGPANVKRGRIVPSATEQYADKILSNHEKWRTQFATRLAKVMNRPIALG